MIPMLFLGGTACNEWFFEADLEFVPCKSKRNLLKKY